MSLVNMAELNRPWAPLTLDEVAARLRGAPFDWWVAGGWAVDLFVGRVTREHKDVEIAVLRKDAEALHNWFATWELWYVPVHGGLKPWQTKEVLESAVHEVWGRRAGELCWQMEMLLENSTLSGEWIYRRDPRITLALERFGTGIDGFPVVRPEIALLYKSKGPRPQDQVDFETVAPLLNDRARRWLAEVLATCGTGRSWLPPLSRLSPP